MISEAERRVKILHYVRQNSANPIVTKSDVMRHMKDDSRAMTTHKTTIELIKEGKIRMVKPKDKPYSQIDYLVINSENEFNKIYSWSIEIGNIINMAEEGPRRKIPEAMEAVDPSNQHEEFMKLVNLVTDFVTPYRRTLETMLQELLYIAIEKTHLEIDLEILSKRILKLQHKLKEQFPGPESVVEELDFLVSERLKKVKLSPLIEVKNSNVNLPNKLIETIEKFKKEFLVDTKQKKDK